MRVLRVFRVISTMSSLFSSIFSPVRRFFVAVWKYAFAHKIISVIVLAAVGGLKLMNVQVWVVKGWQACSHGAMHFIHH